MTVYQLREIVVHDADPDSVSRLSNDDELIGTFDSYRLAEDALNKERKIDNFPRSGPYRNLYIEEIEVKTK